MLTGKWHGALDQTFLDVVPVPVLSTEPETAVVFGGAMQPWKLTGGEPAPALDAAGLRAWAEPGWVKVAMEFRLTPVRGGTGLQLARPASWLPTPAARRRFALLLGGRRAGQFGDPVGGAHRRRPEGRGSAARRASRSGPLQVHTFQPDRAERRRIRG